METITLTKVECYAITASADERSSRNYGYYRDRNLAELEAKNIGWYGSNGTVSSVILLIDEEGNLYDSKPLGKFKDEQKKFKDEMLIRIKSHLTPEEIEFLGI